MSDRRIEGVSKVGLENRVYFSKRLLNRLKLSLGDKVLFLYWRPKLNGKRPIIVMKLEDKSAAMSSIIIPTSAQSAQLPKNIVGLTKVGAQNRVHLPPNLMNALNLTMDDTVLFLRGKTSGPSEKPPVYVINLEDKMKEER